MITLRPLLFLLLAGPAALGQGSTPVKPGVSFSSSDTALQRAFAWAKEEALHFRGKPGDPVGSWYESALPPRSAFCMRDASHQSIGAEILGMSAENKNMFSKFASHISASKNWCTYWEINKWNQPAPADYKNDREFWYNLPSSFDVMYACWRLYVWTGDKTYIDDTPFTYFDRMTVTQYMKEWVLSPDSLLTRPGLPNAPVPFDPEDNYERSRGLPSYAEQVPNLKTGVDLVAAICRGLLTYAAILRTNGQVAEAHRFELKAEQYQRHLETDWWDPAASLYHTYYTNDGQFGKSEGENFLLWFDVLTDSARTRRTIEHMTSLTLNVESQSYLPYLLYRFGYWDKAYGYIMHLADPGTERRDYPEVSYGIVEGVVQGLMGVSVIPGTRIIETVYRSARETTAEIKDLPILQTTIGISHLGTTESVIRNTGDKAFVWRAAFVGRYAQVMVGDKVAATRSDRDKAGNPLSYVEVQAPPGARVDVKVLK